MDARTQALRRLQAERDRARRAFEREARRSREAWTAYEAWQDDGAESLGAALANHPALRRFWSTYLQLAARFAAAETLPEWPYPRELAEGEPGARLQPPKGPRYP